MRGRNVVGEAGKRQLVCGSATRYSLSLSVHSESRKPVARRRASARSGQEPQSLWIARSDHARDSSHCRRARVTPTLVAAGGPGLAHGAAGQGPLRHATLPRPAWLGFGEASPEGLRRAADTAVRPRVEPGSVWCFPTVVSSTRCEHQPARACSSRAVPVD